MRSNTAFKAPYELFEMAKTLSNKNYDIGEIDARSTAWVEIGFGHSRNVTEAWRVGGTVKILLGAGRMNMKANNLKMELAGPDKWLVTADAEIEASAKGLTWGDYNTEPYKNGAPRPEGTIKFKNMDISKAGVGGVGLAFDLGAEWDMEKAGILKGMKLSASLLDLGFISWSNDMQARNMSGTFEFDGFHDVSVSSSNPGPNGSFKSQGQEYSDQLADFANLQDVGDQGGRTTGLGATLNAGVEYSLPVYRKMTFGFLSSTRINGSFSWTEGRLSANWKPLKWLDGGINFAVGSLATSMGWVLNVHPKGFNFFIGMDHILGKTSAEFIPLSSRASANIGMNITW
jgi:hypothetical protein